MDTSLIDFNDLIRTIELRTRNHNETIQSIQYLIDNGFIGEKDFDTAHFTYSHSNGTKVELISDYTAKKYKHIILHSIDFNCIDPSINNYSDVECAITLLNMLNINTAEPFKEFLRKKENYIYNKQIYSISINKNGLIRWAGRFGEKYVFYKSHTSA